MKLLVQEMTQHQGPCTLNTKDSWCRENGHITLLLEMEEWLGGSFGKFQLFKMRPNLSKIILMK